MIQLTEKTITRSKWPRVPRSTFAWMDVDTGTLHGAAGLIRLDEVTAPLIGKVQGRPVRIVDLGYYWLQLAPEGEHWWLTVMFDPAGHIAQYYFDVTLNNRVHGGASTFTDLFLDVVALPDGACELLDQDELDTALASDIITQDQYHMAQNTAAMLMDAVPENIDRLNAFCHKIFLQLQEKIPSV